MAHDETPTIPGSTENPADAAASAPVDPPAAAPADPTGDSPLEGGEAPAKKAAKKAPAKKATAKKAPAKKAATKKAPAKKASAKVAGDPLLEGLDDLDAPADAAADRPAETPAAEKKAPAKKAAAKRTTTKKSASPKSEPVPDPAAPAETASDTEPEAPTEAGTDGGTALLFQPPKTTTTTRTRRTRAQPKPAPEPEAPADDETDDETDDATNDATQTAEASEPQAAQQTPQDTDDASAGDDTEGDDSADGGESGDGGDGGPRRRRRRGGRRRRKSGDSGDGDSGDDTDDDAEGGEGDQSGDRGGNQGGGRNGDRNRQGGGNGGNGNGGRGGKGGGGGKSDATDETEDGDGTTRRRRRRRREGDDGSGGGDDPQNTVTRVRKPRSAEDEITAVAGSTRLEAKKQRRREGREAGRRRAPIVSEAEFLARRESVDRVMVVRQRDELTQIGVLEDKVLVEHYVARESQTSLIGNVYLGRVQNVLPSMEAAFIDIGKGRNAVLYAGEVNWSSLGHKEGSPRKIESVLSSGQSVLVQVTKDPMGHKGARLTSQISLAGRFLVYVPDGTTSGISRKLPDTERTRLKTLLKEIVPDSAGVIVRTAAEGAAEDELTQDVERLKARWEDIDAKSKGGAPKLLYGEPDLTLKVVRDLFTEDFSTLVIQGDDAWDTVHGYVEHVAPDLADRLERYSDDGDVFKAHRIDEQIAKALDRKVWLPSGGSLVIDRTEAMTVVDVNTGKFTGSGGNLEETVTKNNLEAAEEVVRQLRLRDIGGIIVVDFIDMVLESNRDLVLRRMVECLGRDRTRHQVAEVTSLGLVQMTRKRIGTGLLEAFSENCSHCQGRGLVVHDMPVEPSRGEDEQRRGGGRRGGGGSGGGGGRSGRGRGQDEQDTSDSAPKPPSPKDVAAMAKPPRPEDKPVEDTKPVEETTPVEETKPAQENKPAEDTKPAESDQSDGTQPEAGQPRVTQTTRRRSGGRGRAAAQADAPLTDQAEESAPLTQQAQEPAPVVEQAETTPSLPEPTPVVAPVAEPAAATGPRRRPSRWRRRLPRR